MDLLNDPIPKLLRQLAIPIAIGFFFNTMYNVVDSLYAGSIGPEALAALGISFPIFFIIIALGSGFGQGATALIGRALGAKDTNLARTYIFNGLTFITLISVLLSILGHIYAEGIFRYLGASGAYLDYTLAYMSMIISGAVFFLLNNMLNAFLQVQGDTKSFRNALIVGFVLNIILNPMLMYGWLGLPAMGIQGIGLSTVITQILSCVYMGTKVWKSKLMTECLCSFKWSVLKPNLGTYREIAKQGFPASFSMLMVASGMFIYNYFLSQYGSSAIAAFSTGMRIEQIFLLPSVGLNIAVLNLVSQNAGAGNYARVKEIYYTSLKYGAYIAVVCFIGLQTLRFRLMGFFTDDPEVIAIGATYLIFASVLAYFYMMMFQTISVYQGLKKPFFGLFLGLARQFALPLIIIPIMISLYGMIGIWIGVAIIAIISAAIVLFLGLRKVRIINS